ncbi:hypothetical protein EVJ32_04830 [Exiguobacterium sp. SH5S4]|uniref:hypothetical protein n=1 Tax=Exiguobacterium sp. SH5S4 TaxID=2510961 RepID=UPI00103BABDC|nr:hypothetical protein [Exiguobacterium sp. SH5S4]TCI26702.1 hypothetical protein EVJ32_04830 [Exiguobacterium sp. SH5S4]
MKIVTRSNFGLDYYKETVVAENVNEYYGTEMVEAWHKQYGSENNSEYLDLVEDDYELYDGEKELI